MPAESTDSSRPSRRQFLSTAAAGAAALSTAPAFAQGTVASAPRRIRIGVVGGGFGTSFDWHKHPNSIVTAVSDLRPERRQLLSRVYQCPTTHESLEKLILDKNVDAIAIFTGAPDHVRHACAALNAGKHVISAVPAAMTLDECAQLRDAVKKTGLTYMMAETSYFQQGAISARKMFQEGKFGNIFCTETEYHHPGLEVLYFENGQRTWRHGLPPMLYPTHCTAFLVGVTGERLTRVSCVGWGDSDPILKDNAYKNPFWNETAFFTTSKNNACRVAVYWKGAHRGCERARWYGDRMSFHLPDPNGVPAVIVRSGKQTEKDDAGFTRQLPEFERYAQVQWWKTDMLPEPLRHDSGHDGSHTFITHEFVDSLVKGRRPAVDVHEALAYTAPGIVAHQSALQGGIQLPVPSFDPA